MAGGTIVPSIFMCAAVNGEKFNVVRCVFRRHPSDIGRMAGRTVRYKMCGLVVRIDSGLKIHLVAGKTIGWGVGKIAAYMTFGALIYFMSFGQWEKAMVHRFSFPIKTRYIVAFDAIGGKTGTLMVGVCRRLKFIQMAVDAIIADTVKAQCRFRSMAIKTTHRGMSTKQRESIFLM